MSRLESTRCALGAHLDTATVFYAPWGRVFGRPFDCALGRRRPPRRADRAEAEAAAQRGPTNGRQVERLPYNSFTPNPWSGENRGRRHGGWPQIEGDGGGWRTERAS
jgi:hypothetical protein